MDSNKTNFEQRLEQILSHEKTTEEMLQELDDEGVPAVRTLPAVQYDQVVSKLDGKDSLPQDLVDDYEFSRTILRGLITRGTSVLEGAMIVAAETESPRAFETASSIMKSVADMTKDLMSMHNTVKQKNTTIIDKQVNVQNNFTGTNNVETVGDAKSLSSVLSELDDD